MTRRLLLTAILTFTMLAERSSGAIPIARATSHIELDAARRRVTHLSWGTEGTGRERENLIRAGQGISFDDGWDVRTGDAGEIVFRRQRSATPTRLMFPWDVTRTPTTILPSHWADDGTLSLPAIIVAPDFGAMRMTCDGASGASAKFVGDFPSRRLDLIIEIPATRGDVTITLTPHHLAPPAGLSDTSMWPQARRAWLGIFQPSCIDCGNAHRDPNYVPSGLLGNSSIVGLASCSIWFYADQALFTPNASPDVSIIDLVRRTLDWTLRTRVHDDGQVVTYWMERDYADFIDGGPSLLIAAWDYVESSGDVEWLRNRVERLELISQYLERRDIDGDGLVEAVQSGNAGTLVQPLRGCSWWDALNSGHKDGYSNALIYRAWRCLADLESRIGRTAQSRRYGELADRLRAAYVPALMNSETGWLAWWRSADGQLHDYASPVVNGLAIEYGLVSPEQGRVILAKLRAKMAQVGFTRFDLGVPPMLVPVLRKDYLTGIGGTCGEPLSADGADSFGKYMNGGITGGQSLHFLAAHYVIGEPEIADEILRAMLGRALAGGFQNGIRAEYPKGADWKTWDGQPCGADGYLADSYRFLQAALLREKCFRDRIYRPLRSE